MERNYFHMRDRFLYGQNVLFIARNFFSYDKAVYDEFVLCGAEVDLVYDVPFTRSLLKAFLRKMRPIFAPLASKLIEREISAFRRTSYDYVFVILGEGLTSGFYCRLKARYPKAKLILYIWDGIGNNRQYLRKQFKYFDLVASFDPVDCARYNLKFIPLFFVRPRGIEGQNTNVGKKYLFSFVGTSHSSRSKVLAKIRAQFDARRDDFFIFEYLQAKWLYYIYNFWDRRYSLTNIDFISFTSMDYESVLAVMGCSTAILDLPHPGQSGLTIRTIEALGLRKKLITTSPDILKYDFYHPSNIYLIDVDNPEIDEEFLHSDYCELDAEVYEKYHVKAWLRSLFAQVVLD